MSQSERKIISPENLKIVSRTIGYIVVTLSCLLIGACIAIDIESISQVDVIDAIFGKDNLTFFMMILVGYIVFILEYVLRYTTGNEKNFKLHFGLFFLLLIMLFFAIVNEAQSINCNKVICIAILIITLFSVLFYHNLSDLSCNMVKYELIWPSLYIIALAIYTGYIMVAHGREPFGIQKWTLLLIYIAALFYLIILFTTMYSEEITKKWQLFQRWGFAREKVHVWKLNVVGVGILVYLVLIGNEVAEISALCVCICAIMTIFEAWDVISRRNGEERKKYENTLTIVNCAMLFVSAIMLFVAKIIDFEHTIFLMMAMLTADLITIIIILCNYFSQSEGIPNQSSEKWITINKIDVCKIFSCLAVAIVFIVRGLDCLGIIPVEWNLLEWFSLKPVEEWNMSWYSNYVAIVAIVLPVLSGFVLQVIDNDNKELENPKKCSWISFCYSFCSGICLLPCGFWYVNGVESNLVLLQKIIALSYLLAAASGIFFLIGLILLFYVIVNKNKKNGKTVDADEDIAAKESETMNKKGMEKYSLLMIKVFQMLHIPSCILLTLLIVIPSMKNQNSLLQSLLIAAPFVFAAMGSFALNDYYDYEKDKINKPDRILPLGLIKRNIVRKIGIVIEILSLVTGAFIANSFSEMLMYWITTLLAVLYNRYIKFISPVKTFYTALVLTVPFVFAMLKWGTIDDLWLYALGVFLYVAGKEIIMDIFDVEGDRAEGMSTMAVLLGESKTFGVAVACHLGAFVCFGCIYKNANEYLLFYSVIVAIICYSTWFTKRRNVQRIIIYFLWIPLILCTVQGWLV